MRNKNRGGRILNRLRQHRKEAGYTQKEVALMLGHKSNSQLSRWENGVSQPSLENLLRLSFLYHRVVNDLYLDLYWRIWEEMVEKFSRLRIVPPKKLEG